MEQHAEHRAQVAKLDIDRLSGDSGGEPLSTIRGVVCAGHVGRNRVAQGFGHPAQHQIGTLHVHQGVTMQQLPSGDQLQQATAILGLGVPGRVEGNLAAHQSFEALGLALGLESFAETLALDGFDVSQPPTIVQLGDAHQTAYPLRK
ncbi:hypothetical protein D9M69_614750 [compost metagenome]